jgi:hypothetical protein
MIRLLEPAVAYGFSNGGASGPWNALDRNLFEREYHAQTLNAEVTGHLLSTSQMNRL